MDQKTSKLNQAVESLQSRAAGWLQRQIQLSSPGEHPAQQKPAAPDVPANASQTTAITSMSPLVMDRLNLRFERTNNAFSTYRSRSLYELSIAMASQQSLDTFSGGLGGARLIFIQNIGFMNLIVSLFYKTHAIYFIFLIPSLKLLLQNITVHHVGKRGVLPISVSSVDYSVGYLGDVHSISTFVKRDLGFQGQIGLNVLLTYGDTLFSDAKYTDVWRGMTSNSVALATHDPTEVLDVNLVKVNNQSYPGQFCPLLPEYGEDSATWACGITNAIGTGPGHGLLYYLLNNRSSGVNNLIGAGVATISMSDTYPPVPSLTRLPGQQYWWDASCEPWYGDCGSLLANDGYIYAYGHARDLPWVYLIRVPLDSATDLSCYEYWNGEKWQGDRLYKMGEKEGVFWQINQGQIIWSAYYNSYIFIYCDNWMNSKVLAITAERPEGPWSEPVTLYQATPVTAGSSIYAAVPHPYFDASGATLVVTFTNFPNKVQAIKVIFA